MIPLPILCIRKSNSMTIITKVILRISVVKLIMYEAHFFIGSIKCYSPVKSNKTTRLMICTYFTFEQLSSPRLIVNYLIKITLVKNNNHSIAFEKSKSNSRNPAPLVPPSTIIWKESISLTT